MIAVAAAAVVVAVVIVTWLVTKEIIKHYSEILTKHSLTLSLSLVAQNVVEMTLRNVTVEDTGVFICSAKNEIGDAATASTAVIVKRESFHPYSC